LGRRFMSHEPPSLFSPAAANKSSSHYQMYLLYTRSTRKVTR
jgi:hypothetical protein